MLATGLAATGYPLRAAQPPFASGCPCNLGHSRLPLQGCWPWPATPTGGLAVAGYPCKGCGYGRPPLQRAWPWPTAPFLTAFAVKT
ncbi:hypothetical protein GW17_00061976 [Ensete ventricosum]|nr:hypothetical protein GW17_00061976 [Ensete ventricosum]